MYNLNSKDNVDCEITKSKPRIIKKFEKRPPLKVSNKGAQSSDEIDSKFKENKNMKSTPAVEVNCSNNDVQYEKDLFKKESDKSIGLINNNLSCVQDKYDITDEKNLNGSKAIPANQRLSCLVNRLKHLHVASSKVNQEGSNSDNNLSSRNMTASNEKSSCLNKQLSNKNQMNGSQDKSQMWSLSSTIWSPDVQVKSKEISCSLSLEGTLILTNIYSGSLCSTKEYSKSTLLKTLSKGEDNNWELSKKIWSAEQVSHQNNSSKENNLQASQSQPQTSSVQPNGETQFVQQSKGQCDNNSTSIPAKKSRMSMMLERLRSEAQVDHSSLTDSSPTVPPKLSPSKVYSRFSSSPSSPCKSKPSSHTTFPNGKATSISSHRSDDRPRSSCYNCGLDDHKFYNCPKPLTNKFCRRCGWEGVDTNSCPFCTGTLVRPGSTRPVPVGGDARKKYDYVDIDKIREQDRMIKERKLNERKSR